MDKKYPTSFIIAGALTLVALTAIGIGSFSMRWPPIILFPALGLTAICGILSVLVLVPKRSATDEGRLRSAGAVTLLAFSLILATVPLFAQASARLPAALADGALPAAQTETPEPPPSPTASPTATATPDPVLSVNLRDPATFPDWLSAYWWTGQWPDEATQVENTSKMLSLYRQYLLNREVEVEGLTDYGLYYRAARQANQDGWTLPADLELTRRMFAGPQGAAYWSPDGFEYGIFRQPLTSESVVTISFAQISGMIITNTFGVDVMLQRFMSIDAAVAPEGALVEIANNQHAIILHYTNINLASGQRQDYYLPLTVLFSESTATNIIGRWYDYGPERVVPSIPSPVTIPPSICGYKCSFTETSLVAELAAGSGVNTERYLGSRPNRDWNPVVGGLEFAFYIRLSPAPTPVQTPTP